MFKPAGSALGPGTRLTLLALAVSGLLATPAFAADGVGIALRPRQLDPRDNVDRGYFQRSIPAGASFSDQVVVTNQGSASMDLRVYPVDGLTGANSGSVYANRQDPVTRAGAWVTTEASMIAVAPRSERAVGFTVHVPGDAAPGDHLAGVAFENASPLTSQGQFAITRIVRAVMGVLITVDGRPRPFRARVSNVVLRPASLQETTPAVVVQLVNQGQVIGKPYLSVTADGQRGYHRTLRRDLESLLPGDTIEYQFAWPEDFSPGRYHVCASAGAVETPQATYCADLDVPPQGAAAGDALNALPRASPRSSPWLMPAIFLIGLLVGGILVALFTRRRQHRKNR